MRSRPQDPPTAHCPGVTLLETSVSMAVLGMLLVPTFSITVETTTFLGDNETDNVLQAEGNRIFNRLSEILRKSGRVLVDGTTYPRIVGGGATSLIEKKNKDCIFFDKERGCTVYEDRPRQCRTWPFWRYNVYSPRHWKREAKRCPGMNRGHLYPADLIRKLSEDDGSSGSV